MKNRVVVTEVGAIVPIDDDAESFWSGLEEKKVGIGPIACFDITDYKAKLAAGVKDFDAKDYMNPKVIKCAEAFSQFAVAASKEALEDSGLGIDKGNPFRAGISAGSGIGSFRSMEREHKKLLEKGPNRVNPLLIPMMIDDMAAGDMAIQPGLKGKYADVVTVCITGTHSIGEAFRSTQYGGAEVILTGGTEVSICPIGVTGFTALTVLNTTKDPMRASISLGRERFGFVMGEGVGVVVLEPLEHAKVRGAYIYAEVVGYGTTCDAYHITSPVEGGNGTAMAMTYAIQDAGMAPENIDYINAHGTNTHHDNLSETKAIRTALGDHAYSVYINSTKSMVGHLLGVTGGVELITCVGSIEGGYIHAAAGLETNDEECDLDYTKGESVSILVHYAISNSPNFGGHNTNVSVKRFEE